MPFTLNDILYCGVAPLVVSALMLLVVRRFSPAEFGERYAGSLAVLAGFMAAYGLNELGPWMPEAHWHWLPYVLTGAAIVGSIAAATSLFWVERTMLHMMSAGVAAWVLVPDWEDLDPSRTTYLIGFGACVTVLAGILSSLETRLLGRTLPLVQWLTLTASSIILLLSGSLRFTLLAIAGCSAVFGVMLFSGRNQTTPHHSGLQLLFSALLIGTLAIGKVNSFSSVPWIAYLLVPIAPATLCLTATGPISRLTDAKRLFVQLLLPTLILGAAVVIGVWAEYQSAADY